MMDTVWMKVTLVKNNDPYSAESDGVRYVMFGTGGITSFEPRKDGGSILMGQAKNIHVEQSPDYIMDVLSTIRRTGGAFNGEEAE